MPGASEAKQGGQGGWRRAKEVENEVRGITGWKYEQCLMCHMATVRTSVCSV